MERPGNLISYHVGVCRNLFAAAYFVLFLKKV